MEAIIRKIASSLYPDECTDKEVSRIYKIHKYWARKPWYIVEQYISDYSKPGETVMDPFCGSGLTGLEAIINGRNFIGQDLNPTAIRVSSGTMDLAFDEALFKEDFKSISDACKDKIMELYKSDAICPQCGRQLTYKYLLTGPKFDNQHLGHLFCTCGYKEAKHPLSVYDEAQINYYNNLAFDEWVPSIHFPKEFYKDRFSYKGILTVADMYTRRNLYALAILLQEIKKVRTENQSYFKLAFTNTLLHVSKLKGENVRPLSVNNYWIPDDYIEENVWFRFDERIKLIINAKKAQQKRAAKKITQGTVYGTWYLQKKSALEDMGTNFVDYFFTDPPYGEAIQYSELSFIWNSWMEEEYENEEEVIINPAQKKGTKEFNKLLCYSLENIYRALKPQRHFTLCFQNKNSDIWKSVIYYCKHLGFKLVDVSIYNTYGYPFNKSWANFSPKSDIYVTFQKTELQDEFFYDKPETIKEIIKEISIYMNAHEIKADNNKLYDLTISYLIWALYLNKSEIDIAKFDIKKFTEIAKEALEEKTL